MSDTEVKKTKEADDVVLDEIDDVVLEDEDSVKTVTPKEEEEAEIIDKDGESTAPPPPSSSSPPPAQPSLSTEEEEQQEEFKPPPPPPPPPKDKVSGQKFVLSQTGTEVYVTQSPTRKENRKLLILLTNSLGLASENNLSLADEFSKRLGIPVIVPDMFDNDPIPTHGATIMPEEEGVSLLDQIKVRTAGYVKGFLDEMWMAKHTYERTYPQLVSTVAEIAEVYKPKSIAVVGYSFGGRYVLHLLEDGKSNEWSSDEDLISCGVSIHPSLVTQDDFDSVSKPLFLVTQEADEMLPDNVLQTGVTKLQERNVKFDRTTFGEGATEPLPHGFAVPGDYPQSLVGDKPQQVLEKAAAWIQEHL